jgi:O-antigen ligase
MQQLLNNKIHIYLTAAIAFCLPVYSNLIPPLVVVLILLWLLKPKEIMSGLNLLVKNRAASAMASLFLLYAIGVLYSLNINEGMQILETKLSLIAFPLIFSTQIKNCKENINLYLRFFIYGCLLSAAICFGWALYCYLKPVYVTIDGMEYNLGASYFYYARLSIFIHPSYISMYFNFALLAIFHLVKAGEIKINWKWVFVISLITVFILLLSSKAGWLGLFLIALFTIVSLLIRKQYFAVISILVILPSLFYLLNISAPEYSQRITAATQSVAQSGSVSNLEKSNEGTASRILVWNAALEIIKENFVVGTGTGDAKAEMIEKYKEKGMTTEYEHKLNSHNQYLNTFIALGVFGFICLLLSLLFPFIHSLKYGQMLLGTFACLAGLNFLFESMLETQAGVMFYAFFYALLCFSFFDFTGLQQLKINNEII